MAHSPADHKARMQFPKPTRQEHQGTVYIQAKTKIKQLSDDVEHKKDWSLKVSR